MAIPFQVGPYRPPSEPNSLLVRATRNSPRNRCKFCCMYKGHQFECRSVEEIKQDIREVKTVQDRIKEISWKFGNGASGLRKAPAMVLGDSPDEAFRHVALWLYAGGDTAFLQDSNTLIMRTKEPVKVIRFLKETLPTIKRVTSYGRSDTAAHKSWKSWLSSMKPGFPWYVSGWRQAMTRCLSTWRTVLP